MRHGLITFFAALAGVLVALFSFHLYQRFAADRERAAIDAEQQARIKQGRQLVERSIADERAVAAIRNDVAAAAMARLAIAEYYMSNGRMPASNAEAGLPAPETYRGHALRSMTVAGDGSMVLEFDAASGVDGGRIEWQPDLAGIESMGMQWRCSTHDFPQIARALPDCAYLPPAGDGGGN